MGCTQSNLSDDERINNTIDEAIQRDQAMARKTTKMLLLGAGESGKSTIVKQLRLMHQGSYTEDERIEYRDVILANAFQSMQVILDALPHLELELEDEMKEAGKAVAAFDADLDIDSFLQFVAAPLYQLTTSHIVKEAIANKKHYQLNDSAEYFFSVLDRMSQPDYLPTDEDILRSRVKTTGVIEHQIQIKGQLFKVTDVGGQRSERKKWLNVFADIDVLLWVVALSEYDQRLREDDSVSRMEEAVQLFGSTINSQWFERSTVMLFLNKIDLFSQKLKTEPLHHYVSDFPPERDTDTQFAAKFLRQKFLDLYRPRGPGKQVYCHMTTATETRAMRAILNAVTDSVIKGVLQSTGLL